MAHWQRKVILVGVGGATCSGKTVLAKYLKGILPNSIIIHQDDFWPPIEMIPIHPVYKVQDCDSAEGCIDWPRLISFLRQIKETGEIPPDHRSYDHLNSQKEVPVEQKILDRWKMEFQAVEEQYRRAGIEVTWGLVDGFVLYWDMDVVAELDIRIYLRVPEAVLKQRRDDRSYKVSDGTTWCDPPNYWENIVWPAHVEAHSHIFLNGDLAHGAPNGKVKDLVVIDGVQFDMDQMIDIACKNIVAACKSDGAVAKSAKL